MCFPLQELVASKRRSAEAELPSLARLTPGAIEIAEGVFVFE
jgi:hypothetical protein